MGTAGRTLASSTVQLLQVSFQFLFSKYLAPQIFEQPFFMAVDTAQENGAVAIPRVLPELSAMTSTRSRRSIRDIILPTELWFLVKASMATE